MPATGEKARVLQERREFFGRMYQTITHLAGDVVECGVGRGTSFAFLCALIEKEGKDRQIWGFDAWQSEEYPRTEYDPAARTVPTYPFKLELILEKAHREGAPNARHFSHFVRGFVEDTLPIWVGPYLVRPLALVHLDLDLYSGTRVAIESLWPLIPRDGLIIFDEYHDAGIWPGEKKAVDEFCALLAGPHTLTEDYRWHLRKL